VQIPSILPMRAEGSEDEEQASGEGTLPCTQETGKGTGRFRGKEPIVEREIKEREIIERDIMERDIMIVDDDSANLTLLEGMLRQQGYEVRSFPAGRLALSAAQRNPPGLILLDINMPEMNGYEVCEHLKSNAELFSIPVIFLSALQEVEDKVAGFRVGGADYICKPFQIEEVQARVATHLNLHALRQALQRQNAHLEALVSQRTEQLQLALQQIESTYNETLQALGGALDLRDNETAGHSQRVTRYALEIAQAMKCSPDELKHLALGAFLHDLGKIGISDAVLHKPGPLTPEETEIMRQHVRIGYDMVSGISFLSGAAEILLAHHECFNGTGYPRALVGERIPLGARIFSVADTLDAMTSDRPYRNALSFQLARDEIARCSGSQFDPEVVRAFLSIPQEDWHRMRTQTSLLCFADRGKSQKNLEAFCPSKPPAQSTKVAAVVKETVPPSPQWNP
jgi:response regulator RpfG family c-di-GMP phosphodiesterase